MHTPGPWAINDSEFLSLNIVVSTAIEDEDERIVAEVEHGRDARLIAAAPDLLEALEAVANSECWNDGEEDYLMVLQDARSLVERAIAKAKGESHE